MNSTLVCIGLNVERTLTSLLEVVTSFTSVMKMPSQRNFDTQRPTNNVLFKIQLIRVVPSILIQLQLYTFSLQYILDDHILLISTKKVIKLCMAVVYIYLKKPDVSRPGKLRLLRLVWSSSVTIFWKPTIELAKPILLIAKSYYYY